MIICFSLLLYSETTFSFEKRKLRPLVINGIKIKRCATNCHTPENIKLAQRQKREKEECAQCHLGEEDFSGKKAANSRNLLASNNPLSIPRSLPQMALIPAGEFIMGTNERWDDEGPMYKTYLPDYYLDIYEVSNREYKKFVDATGHKAPLHWKNKHYPKGKGNHPVVYVNWYDADAYCRWAGKRLPSNEEWEKGARGPKGLEYPWGNSFDPFRSNNPVKGSTGTEPVDSYPEGKSPYGLYNMSGNVWEWTSSWYLAYPGNTKPRPNYGKTNKVLKGGSWYNCEPYDCGISAPSFNRAPFEPTVKSHAFGFRCAKDADKTKTLKQ